MKLPFTLKTEYLIFVLACVFWLADVLLDMKLFTEDRGRLFQGIETTVFVVQLAFFIFLWKLIRMTSNLKESLEKAQQATVDEAAKVQAIVEAMVDPVSVQDRDFNVLYQNQAHRDLMGEHHGERCYRAYVGKDAVCDDCHLEKTFVDGTSHRKEVTLRRNTSPVELEILSSPLRDSTGAIVAGIEVIRDVTQWKKTEEEMLQLNQDLERRARELAGSYRELEAFSYSVSHDLRAPLTRIYSAAQFLEEQYADQLDEEGRFFVRTICEAGEHMEELIEALMDLAKVTSSEMVTENVDLVPIAREIISDLEDSEPGRNVDFILPDELPAMGDRQLLTVLLENLLGNSWKYTGKTEKPTIELRSEIREERTVYFVRDNGAGFPMKEVDKLFKPFRRLHASADFPGTGVGLATVQRIIQRHGGEVWAEGEVDKGATFFFTLH